MQGQNQLTKSSCEFKINTKMQYYLAQNKSANIYSNAQVLFTTSFLTQQSVQE